MGKCQRLCHLARNKQGLLDRQLLGLGDQLLQCASTGELHRQKIVAVEHIRVKDLRNVRMAQLGHGLALALKARRELGVAGEMRIKQLKRHILVQGAVTCAIHQPHPATRNVAADFVRANECACGKRLDSADGICWICHIWAIGLQI